MKSEDFTPGDQIVYIPNHADGPRHRDAEHGFVTSVNEKFVFCRYWVKYDPLMLRTMANSEATLPRNLVKMNTRPQYIIDELLKRLYSNQFGE